MAVARMVSYSAAKNVLIFCTGIFQALAKRNVYAHAQFNDLPGRQHGGL